MLFSGSSLPADVIYFLSKMGMKGSARSKAETNSVPGYLLRTPVDNTLLHPLPRPISVATLFESNPTNIRVSARRTTRPLKCRFRFAPALNRGVSLSNIRFNYTIDWILGQTLQNYPGVPVGTQVHVTDAQRSPRWFGRVV